jgi:uncharacterized protein YbcI
MATDQDDRMAIDGREHARPAGGELNAAITRAVVAIHRRQVGRGPTKAHAFFRNDVVVVVLSNVMTTPERRLVADGRGELVAEMRHQLQATMHDALVAAVERLTGCGVTALMSDIHVGSDTAVEVFVLDRPVHAEEPAGQRA